MESKFFLIITFLLLFSYCSRLPSKLSQAPSVSKELNYEVKNDSLKINFNNPLECPLRISAISPDKIIQKKLNRDFPIIIDPREDVALNYWTDKPKDETSIKFSIIIGDPNESIHIKKMNLPFKKDAKYQIMQGYNGSFSHTSEYGRYALDFNLMEGDTICAAADGYVIGVIEGYTKGGTSKRWEDYSNYITIFHPDMNLYSQYVHLMHNGSLVEVGDYVKSGQVIGLSGKTGYTSGEHLHFNVLKPNESWMESVQIQFNEGYRGIDLKKGDWVEN